MNWTMQSLIYGLHSPNKGSMPAGTAEPAIGKS